MSEKAVMEREEKAHIERNKSSMNPTRRKMTVSDDSYEKIHNMNKEALKILAKQS